MDIYYFFYNIYKITNKTLKYIKTIIFNNYFTTLFYNNIYLYYIKDNKKYQINYRNTKYTRTNSSENLLISINDKHIYKVDISNIIEVYDNSNDSYDSDDSDDMDNIDIMNNNINTLFNKYIDTGTHSGSRKKGRLNTDNNNLNSNKKNIKETKKRCSKVALHNGSNETSNEVSQSSIYSTLSVSLNKNIINDYMNANIDKNKILIYNNCNNCNNCNYCNNCNKLNNNIIKNYYKT